MVTRQEMQTTQMDPEPSRIDGWTRGRISSGLLELELNEML